jgi:hypothetical protein
MSTKNAMTATRLRGAPASACAVQAGMCRCGPPRCGQLAHALRPYDQRPSPAGPHSLKRLGAAHTLHPARTPSLPDPMPKRKSRGGEEEGAAAVAAAAAGAAPAPAPAPAPAASGGSGSSRKRGAGAGAAAPAAAIVPVKLRRMALLDEFEDAWAAAAAKASAGRAKDQRGVLAAVFEGLRRQLFTALRDHTVHDDDLGEARRADGMMRRVGATR